MIDLHCHIFPGLDDGAKDMKQSIEMARMAQRDGIKKIVATFHLFRANYFYKQFDWIEEKKKELTAALRDNGVDMEIYSGAEIYISHNLVQEIRKNRQYLTINGSSYLFLEFPQAHVFSGVKELFFELLTEGIIPIISHPERNHVFERNPGMIYDLIQRGGFAQANSGSFLGLYGREAQETAFRLLKLNLIQFIASDSHSPRPNGLWLSGAVKKVEALVGREMASALVTDNPQAVLNDKEIPYVFNPLDPVEKEKKLTLRIPSFLRKKKKI